MPTIGVDCVDLFHTEGGAERPVLFIHGIPTD
jgi:pimeloyl-ACP methyl ester carboxylesterase